MEDSISDQHPPLFQVALIETVNVCNRKCWFCKFGQPRQKESVEWMSWELIEKIVLNLRDLDYAGRVSWFKINEPLVDRRMVDVVALTKLHLPKCCCALLTNGDLLTDDVFQKLSDAGLDRLGVSVYDDETFERMNSLKCCAQLSSIEDRRRPLESDFVESRADNIDLAEGNLSPNITVANRITQNCLRPSTAINIVADGSAVLCCNDFYKDTVMGNANESRLEEIWYGENFQRYRDALAERGRGGLPLCERCTWNGRGHRRNYP